MGDINAEEAGEIHYWGRLGAVLGRSWAVLRGLGAVLEPSWAVLGGLEAVLGRSWGVLGCLGSGWGS